MNKNKEMQRNSVSAGGGVFLIGLALLFITGFWWPGIMFVIGASMIANTLSQGKDWRTATPAFVVIGIGLVFWIPQFLSLSFGLLIPVALIGAGLFLLFGGKHKERLFDQFDDREPKTKNDQYDWV